MRMLSWTDSSGVSYLLISSTFLPSCFLPFHHHHHHHPPPLPLLTAAELSSVFKLEHLPSGIKFARHAPINSPSKQGHIIIIIINHHHPNLETAALFILTAMGGSTSSFSVVLICPRWKHTCEQSVPRRREAADAGCKVK